MFKKIIKTKLRYWMIRIMLHEILCSLYLHSYPILLWVVTLFVVGLFIRPFYVFASIYTYDKYDVLPHKQKFYARSILGSAPKGD